MILANVYYGAKKWEYELNFNSDFTKITHGLLLQYDEKNEIVKIDSLLDFDQCYDLQIQDLPDKNKTQPCSFKTNDFKIYPDMSQENNLSSSKSIPQKYPQKKRIKRKNKFLKNHDLDTFSWKRKKLAIDESIDESIDDMSNEISHDIHTATVSFTAESNHHDK